MGAPTLLTDQDGKVVADIEATPFGEAYIDYAVVEHNRRFPGQYKDEETGLHYNYFRDYDPSLGRYIQSDPIGLGGGVNTYAYAANNPVIFTDPEGLFIPALVTAYASNPVCVSIAVASFRGLAGAAIGGLTAMEEISRDPCFKGDTDDAILAAAGLGALAGILPGGASLKAAAVGGASAGSIGNTVGQYHRNDGFHGFDPFSNARAAGVGMFASSAGYGAGLQAYTPAVAASYSSSISILAGFIGNVVNYGISESYTDKNCDCPNR